jgi:hypothetical protein
MTELAVVHWHSIRIRFGMEYNGVTKGADLIVAAAQAAVALILYCSLKDGKRPV